MSRLRIGVLIDRVWLGGVEKIAINQVKALREIGAEAALLVLRRENVDFFAKELKEIPVIYLDDKLPRILKFSFKFPFFSFFSFFHLTYPFFIPSVLKDFDTIISHGTYTSLTALSIKKTKKVKLVLVMWDPAGYILKKAYNSGPLKWLSPLLVPLANWLDKRLVKGADMTMVGGSGHDVYLKDLGARSIFKNPPGVYPAKELPKERENFILSVTAWKQGKQPEYHFELMKSLPNYNLIMAGAWIPAAYQKEFQRGLEQQGLEKQIRLTGELSESELNDYYRKARVFLQTNDDRGFGLAALEAAAQGCPFVIPDGQGVCELFAAGEEGFFTKERDTQVILKHLNALLSDQKLAESMGAKAWDKVVKNYSWKKHAEKILKEVEE